MQRSVRFIVIIMMSVTGSACQPQAYAIAVPMRVEAGIDVARFQRVHVAGLVTQASDPIDTNEEMVRLLKSQLRSRSRFHVVDAEVQPVDPGTLSDSAYWKQVGEEYLEPLIVTGTVTFTRAAEMVSPPVPLVPVWPTRSGRQAPPPQPQMPPLQEMYRFVLSSTFVFIDGTTGTPISTRSLRHDVMYRRDVEVPPLAAFFELADRQMPPFLQTVSDQTFVGSRLLLR